MKKIKSIAIAVVIMAGGTTISYLTEITFFKAGVNFM